MNTKRDPVRDPIEEITEDDATIARMLEDAHIPTLMTALSHITGNTDHLRGPIRPKPTVINFDMQMSLTEDEQAQARTLALKILGDYRDNGCQMPPEPSEDMICEMMDYIMGEAIPRDYLPLLQEELALLGNETRVNQWRRDAVDVQDGAFKVLIIGAGMSGILAAIALQQGGIPFEIIEKNEGVGGTWFENTYPGCRVDSPNHLYSYSFEPNHDWPQYFSTHDTLFGYFDRLVDAYGLRDFIRFETDVEEAAFDDETHRWAVTIKDKSGAIETLDANAVIAATGQLNRPKWPDIPGQEKFQGDAFHSAEWRHDIDLTGKKVAVIGTGASAFQFVPEITKVTGDTLIFQRTPPWIRPAEHYHLPVPDGMKWLMKHMPFFANWYRFWLFWLSAEGLLPRVKVDPAWNDLRLSVGPENQALREELITYMRDQISDPDLADLSVPNYPPGGKRMLVDNGSWFKALQRDNVEIITDPIKEITETGVLCESGDRHDVDVLIYGTGFKADKFLFPMTIKGRNGVDLNDHWAGDPRAYLGITVPGFPNLFCLYGPNTNIVVNGSIIFFSECEMRYVIGCLKMLIEEGHDAMDCREDVHDAYNEKIDAENAQYAWGSPHVNSWYKNDQGRVTQNWPGPLLEYWTLTKAPDPADYRFL
ncbi:MAG: flavin-containing monooxygenase [Alphaproteobacteria bacterium]